MDELILVADDKRYGSIGKQISGFRITAAIGSRHKSLRSDYAAGERNNAAEEAAPPTRTDWLP
jgi:hypothetical protein